MVRCWQIVVVLLLCAATAAGAQHGNLTGSEPPLPVSEIAPGVFVHIGATALMTRQNEGAIANV